MEMRTARQAGGTVIGNSGSMMRARVFWILLAVIAALYVGHALSIGYVSDDGYIALRYVRNYLAGHGFVYNPGERVEGYTSFAWVALLGILGRLLPGVALDTMSQLVGLIFGVATVVVTAAATQSLWPGRRWTALGAATLVAGSTGFAAWATGGLETTLFAFTVIVAAWAYLADLESGRHPFVVGALLGLMALTRPDGMVLAAVAGVHYLVHCWRTARSAAFRRVVLMFLGVVVVFGPWFAWRWWYYGWPLPNTYYAKVGSGMAQYRRGVRYLLNYGRVSGAAVWCLPALVLLVVRRDPRRDLVALLLASHLAYIIYVGGDGLRFQRFLAYTAPLTAILAAQGIAALAGLFRSRAPRYVPAIGAAALMLAAASSAYAGMGPVLAPAHFGWSEPQSRLHFPVSGADARYFWFDNYFVQRQEAAARWLDAHTCGPALVAATPAGAIAYYSRFDVIDMLGLNDAHIGHMQVSDLGNGRAGHEKGDGAYVLSRKPEYILLGNVAVLGFPITDSIMMSHKLVRRSEKEIWANPEFHRDYERVAVRLATDGPFQWFTFYRRRGLGLAQSGSHSPCSFS